MNKLKIITNGIIKENPVLVLVLGTCATLALSSQAVNAFGMGLATTFVLLGSNVLIAMLRKVIPDEVRLPAYIVIIASFVTIVELVIKGYAPALNDSLGIFIPLIVVNCIILGRAEMFANKNTVIDSALDGIGMGIGFTLTLLVMGLIREFLGAGSLFGFPILSRFVTPMNILTLAPGGFFVFGLLIAVINWINRATGNKVKVSEGGCENCPTATICGGAPSATGGTTQEGDINS